jgi:hypothetical protein
MSDIFISYASDDKSRVEPLAEALESNGWSVWWDRIIPAGKTFDEVIEKAVNGASCIVVVWSDKSISSRWVRTEADEGANRQILVPVLIDNVKIPLAFKRIQAANLIGWQGNLPHPGFDKLVKDISGLIGPPSAPQIADTSCNTYVGPYGQSPARPPQRSSASLPERKQRVGLIGKTIPIALLVLWLLGFIGGVGGGLVHLLLLLSLVLFIINTARWLSNL